MKKLLKKCLFFSAFLALFTSCKPTDVTKAMPNKNGQSELLLNHTWKLVGITFHEKDQYIIRPEKEKGLTVSFKAEGKLSYKLSVNNCFGSYTLDGENMTATHGGCTKMCCDSEFANDFQNILSTAKSYKIHGTDYLDVKGTEKILKLERVKD